MDWDFLVTTYVQPIPISSYVYIYIMQYQSINDIQWSLVYLSYCILWIIINPSNCRPARPMNSSMDGFLVSMLFTGSSNSRTPVMSDMSVWRVVSAKTSVWWTATAAVCRGAMHQSYCRNEWSFLYHMSNENLQHNSFPTWLSRWKLQCIWVWIKTWYLILVTKRIEC